MMQVKTQRCHYTLLYRHCLLEATAKPPYGEEVEDDRQVPGAKIPNSAVRRWLCALNEQPYPRGRRVALLMTDSRNSFSAHF